MRIEGFTQQEIADRIGFKTTGAVSKRIAKLAAMYEQFVSDRYDGFLGEH